MFFVKENQKIVACEMVDLKPEHFYCGSYFLWMNVALWSEFFKIKKKEKFFEYLC